MNNKPFLLKPAAKDYLWGGSRLNDDFKFGMDCEPFAEAWVCSTHPDGCSNLTTGTHASTVANGHFPILIKLIDANKDLSVQVHPDDEYSLANEGQLGKTELWYVLDAKKDASLIYGFNRDVEADEVKQAIDDGTVGNLLNHVPVKKNDLFFIESGTVHFFKVPLPGSFITIGKEGIVFCFQIWQIRLIGLIRYFIRRK